MSDLLKQIEGSRFQAFFNAVESQLSQTEQIYFRYLNSALLGNQKECEVLFQSPD
jgi:hypothetical protein